MEHQKNIERIHKFLDILFLDSDRIALSCFSEPKNINTIPFNLVNTKEKIKNTITNNFIETQIKEQRNICVCPNIIKEGGQRNNDNIELLNALYIDIDDSSYYLNNPDIAKQGPPPHLILKRDKKFHLYWLLDRPAKTEKTLKKFTELEEYLINLYRADKAVKDAARALRLPYTPHLKETTRTGYNVIHYENIENTKRYNIDYLHKKYVKKIDIDTVSAPGIECTEINDNSIIEFIKSLYYKKEKIYKGEGRSQQLFFIGLDCYGWGLQKEKAVSIAEEINQNIIEPPEDSPVLQHQIESAYRYSKTGFGEYRESINTSKNNQERQKKFKQYSEFQKIREMLKDFVYVIQAERLINLENGYELKTTVQINNEIAHRCKTKLSFIDILMHRLITVVEEIDFRPEIKERIFNRTEIGDIRVFNRFRGLRIENKKISGDEKEIEIFINHIKYLTNNKEEYEAVLNFFGYIVQNPGSKLPYALLIVSKEHGIGKSALETLFRNMYTPKTGYKEYIGSVENRQLTRGYTHFLEDRIFLFVHELMQGDRDHTMNQLKNIITEPTVEIEGKWARPYTVKNTTNFIMFSNHINAVRIDRRDRRLLVINNEKLEQKPEYYKELFEVFKSIGGAQLIYSYLSQKDLSKFNPHIRPIFTQGKQELIESNLSELNLYLMEKEKNREGPFKYTLLNPQLLLEYIEQCGLGSVKRYSSLKTVKNYLIEQGYKSELIETRLDGERIYKVFWTKPVAGESGIKFMKKQGTFKTVLKTVLEQAEIF